MDYLIRRIIVIVFSVMMIGLSLANLSSGLNNSTVHFIGSGLVFILSLYGLYGAFSLTPTHIKWFSLLLAATWIYLLIYTIINVVTLNISHAFLDVIMMGIVFFGAIVSAELSWALSNDDRYSHHTLWGRQDSGGNLGATNTGGGTFGGLPSMFGAGGGGGRGIGEKMSGGPGGQQAGWASPLTGSASAAQSV